jgi:hypothetical protein
MTQELKQVLFGSYAEAIRYGYLKAMQVDRFAALRDKPCIFIVSVRYTDQGDVPKWSMTVSSRESWKEALPVMDMHMIQFEAHRKPKVEDSAFAIVTAASQAKADLKALDQRLPKDTPPADRMQYLRAVWRYSHGGGGRHLPSLDDVSVNRSGTSGSGQRSEAATVESSARSGDVTVSSSEDSVPLIDL